MLYRFIYLSSATEPMTDADIDRILAASRRNNTPNGITGLLMYHDGLFLQVLEGPKEAVTACVARIKRDPRHDTIFRLSSGPVERRAFGEWRMGFARPQDFVDGAQKDGAQQDAAHENGAQEGVIDLHEFARPDSPERPDDPDVRRAVRSFLECFRFLRSPPPTAA